MLKLTIVKAFCFFGVKVLCCKWGGGAHGHSQVCFVHCEQQLLTVWLPGVDCSFTPFWPIQMKNAPARERAERKTTDWYRQRPTATIWPQISDLRTNVTPKTRLCGVTWKTHNWSYRSLYEKRGGSSAGCRNRSDSKSILSEPIHHEELTHSSWKRTVQNESLPTLRKDTW